MSSADECDAGCGVFDVERKVIFPSVLTKLRDCLCQVTTGSSTQVEERIEGLTTVGRILIVVLDRLCGNKGVDLTPTAAPVMTEDDSGSTHDLDSTDHVAGTRKTGINPFIIHPLTFKNNIYDYHFTLHLTIYFNLLMSQSGTMKN
jgi:hypothetical protein